MAKKKSFDPDALAEAGKEILSKHQSREQVKVTPDPAKNKKALLDKEATQLCRIGISYHKKAKLTAVQNDMTIRAYLENLIEKDFEK